MSVQYSIVQPVLSHWLSNGRVPQNVEFFSPFSQSSVFSPVLAPFSLVRLVLGAFWANDAKDPPGSPCSEIQLEKK